MTSSLGSRIGAAWYFLRTLCNSFFIRRLSRKHVLKWQEWMIRRHLRRMRDASPYIARMASKYGGCGSWRRWPLMGKEVVMGDFLAHNTLGIPLEKAFEVALAAERTRDFTHDLGDVTVGLSSGTSMTRGVFMVSPAERAVYLGAIFGKALPAWWREPERVALVLRANSTLYTSIQKGRLQFAFFDLFSPFAEVMAGLEAWKPTILVAPASVLRALADRKSILNQCVRRIYSVAEVLEQDDRRVIEAQFGVKCGQIYQCTEGFLGITCECGTLHLNEDLVSIEMEPLPPTSDGKERFNPIITDFVRTTQPIIRYRMNDVLVVRPDPCPCGSSFLAIDRIEGRLDDVISLPCANDETQVVQMFPDLLHRAMARAGAEEILHYRIIQEDESTLYVELSWQEQEGVDRDRQQRIEHRIAASLEQACRACHARPPALRFRPYLFSPDHNKLRRIMRLKKPSTAGREDA